MKGFAILAIIGHNFYHRLPPLMGENEFYFQSGLFDEYVRAATQFPERFLRYLFSYLGHLGVQVFIFLTAYGYSKKFNAAQPPSTSYLLKRFVRIYIAFLVAIVIYVLLISLALLLDVKLKSIAPLEVLYRIGLVSNVIPHQALEVVGPWWYVSFLLQVILCLPFLIRAYRRFGKRVAFAAIPVFVAVEWLFNPMLIRHGLNINHTVIGFMPLLVFGVAFGHGDFSRISSIAIVGALGILALSNYFELAWFVYDIAFVVVVMIVYQVLAIYWRGSTLLSNGLAYCGSISLYLFLVNGFIRLPFRMAAIKFDSSLVNIGLFVGVVVASAAIGVCIMRIEEYVYMRLVRRIPRIAA